MNMNRFKYQRGFILITVVVIAIAFIVVAVLYATGIIETPRVGTDTHACEALLERCEESCSNDSSCKDDCYSAYQACKGGRGK